MSDYKEEKQKEYKFAENIEIKSNGSLVVRGGWKSFRGMVYQLKLINRRYLKNGIRATYTITLPLKP